MSKCQMDFSKKRICNLDIGSIEGTVTLSNSEKTVSGFKMYWKSISVTCHIFLVSVVFASVASNRLLKYQFL